MSPTHGPEEIEWLDLLQQVQALLASYLDLLPNKPKTPQLWWLRDNLGTQINIAAGGYICLRRALMVHASKLLVRPALEAYLDAAAFKQQPGYFFYKWYWDAKEARGLYLKDSENWNAANSEQEKLKIDCASQYPEYAAELDWKQKPSAKIAAETAKNADILPRVYKIYCNYTHGSLAAHSGDFDSLTDAQDTRFMIWLVLETLDILQSSLGETCDLRPHKCAVIRLHQKYGELVEGA